MMTKPKKTERRKHSQSVVSANADVTSTENRCSENGSAGDHSRSNYAAPAGTMAALSTDREVEGLQQPECQPCSLYPDAEFDMAVRELAYLKWEAAGFPEGDGFDFWLEAERELRANQTPETPASE